jgi:hypothetical protein
VTRTVSKETLQHGSTVQKWQHNCSLVGTAAIKRPCILFWVMKTRLLGGRYDGGCEHVSCLVL